MHLHNAAHLHLLLLLCFKWVNFVAVLSYWWQECWRWCRCWQQFACNFFRFFKTYAKWRPRRPICFELLLLVLMTGRLLVIAFLPLLLWYFLLFFLCAISCKCCYKFSVKCRERLQMRFEEEPQPHAKLRIYL